MSARIARLKYCNISTDDGWRTRVYFPDGSFCDAVPHDTHHYHVISHRCGYADNIGQYCFEHEVAHELVAEFFWDIPSPVLMGVACGQMMTGLEAALEELMAQTLQRFARAGERPIIGGVDWDTLKARFLQLVEGA